MPVDAARFGPCGVRRAMNPSSLNYSRYVPGPFRVCARTVESTRVRLIGHEGWGDPRAVARERRDDGATPTRIVVAANDLRLRSHLVPLIRSRDFCGIGEPRAEETVFRRACAD